MSKYLIFITALPFPLLAYLCYPLAYHWQGVFRPYAHLGSVVFALCVLLYLVFLVGVYGQVKVGNLPTLITTYLLSLTTSFLGYIFIEHLARVSSDLYDYVACSDYGFFPFWIIMSLTQLVANLPLIDKEVRESKFFSQTYQ